MLIDGNLVKGQTAHEDWGSRIPIIMQPAGGLPYRGFDWMTIGEDGFYLPDWPTTWGQPIFAANRNVYKTLDMILTWEMRIIRKFSRPLGIGKTQSGDPLVASDDLELDRVNLLNARIGEDFNWVQPPSTPRERSEVLSYLSGAAQRGGLSNIAFGELGLELPGVAVERLMAATKSTLAPYVETAEFTIAELCMGFLQMYRQGGFPAVTLNVKRNYGGESLQVYQEEFRASKIPETTLVNVKLPLGLPDRKLQNMATARTAIPGNEPLLDDVTVAEEILEVADYELVKDRIAEMRAERHPGLQAIGILQAMRRRRQDYLDMNDQEGADMVQRVIDITLQQLQVQLGGQSAPAGPEAPRQRETAPGVAPPEMGGMPPDELMAQRPQAPAAGAPGGQPTVEQRLRSIGLVPPRG